MEGFEQALHWASDGGTGKVALLLGNGFSMAYDSDRFSYGALATLAENKNLLPAIALRVMESSGSRDFEALMRDMEAAATTLEAMDPVAFHGAIQEIRNAIFGVREALAQSVAGLHPDRPFDVPTPCYRSTRAFLDRFHDIYTVSYDLLLYWSLMQEVGDGGRAADDGFRDSRIEGDDTVLWNVYNPHSQSVHYLHGALHLYGGLDGLRKITYSRTGDALIDQIRFQLAAGRYPLFVAEGESKEKLARITASAYLSKALRSLSARGSGLVIYGHSLDHNDDHVFEAIVRSKIRRVAVSIYGDVDSPSNREIRHRATEIVARRSDRNSRVPLDLKFFDASSVGLWQAP